MAVEAALAPREREERLDQPLLLRADRQHLLAQVCAERVDVCVRIGERDLDQCALERERGAQLVRGVGDELPLRVERGLEAREQLVEGVPELSDLVVGPASARRRCRLLAEISRAAFAIVRSGRRARPATSQPSQIEISAMSPSAIPDWISSWCNAALDCACACGRHLRRRGNSRDRLGRRWRSDGVRPLA